MIELIGGNWKKLPIICMLVGCRVDFGVMMLSGEHDDAFDDDDEDNGFLGTSIIEPPDNRPERILSGLGSGIDESGDGDIEIIEPPDDPNRGTDSSLRATILMSPPHICSNFEFIGETFASLGGTGEKRCEGV